MVASKPGSPVPTAFVLVGGGSLGAVQVGMLRGLLEWRELPTFLVGASAGSLNAAIFAGNPSLEGVMHLAEIWRSFRRRDVFPVQLNSLVWGLFGQAGYLVDPRGLRSMIERNVAYKQLEEAVAQVHVVATDVTTGKGVVLSTGSVVEAVLASTAIPGILPPVRIAGHTLVDGGLSTSATISVAVALGAKRVIVLPTGFACARRGTSDALVPRSMHGISMVTATQLVRDAEHWINSHIVLRIVPALCPLSTSPYDFSVTEELMVRAHQSTQMWLEDGGLESDAIPRQMYPHEHHLDPKQ